MLELLSLFIKLFSKYKISYVLTGSFAVSYYGYPRATHDIDFVIEISKKQAKKISLALAELDSSFLKDKKAIRQALSTNQPFNILHLDSGIKIDFWVEPNKEFEKSKMLRKRTIRLSGIKISLISPEDLILTKLLWSKSVRSERHIRDCVGIWKLQQEKLDERYILHWVKKMDMQNLWDEIKTMQY